MSTDLTGSHLDAATGRDEIAAAADAEDGDSDDDDDDESEVGTRAARQAAAVKGGQAAGAGGEEGAGASGGRASSDIIAAAVAAAVKGKGAGDDAGLDGEVKELERNKLVRTFFRGLLKEWEMDLNARPDQVKRTVQGKLETKTQKQAKDYMRPLFKLCKQKVCAYNMCIHASRGVCRLFYVRTQCARNSLCDLFSEVRAPSKVLRVYDAARGQIDGPSCRRGRIRWRAFFLLRDSLHKIFLP